jgi:site-specific DNA-cytosine methylase
MSISTGSLFSGVCSEHWALSCLVDTRPVFAADNDRYAARFIRQNVRPGILVEEDLARVPVQSLPYVDVFLAGAPCQSFSTIGRRNDGDERSHLYTVPLDYARAKKPKYFIFENVPLFQKSEHFPRLVEGLQNVYACVEHAVLNAADFGSIQQRKRLFVVASDEPVRLPQGRACSPPPLSTVLDPAGSPFKYLSDKGKAYLGRRARWGVKIYGRNDRSFLGTLPRSYGHMQSWKHTIDEGAGRWRDLTATEAFRIQSFDPRGFDLSGLSRRQQMYLAGNAIDQCVLKALFKSLL